MGEGGAKKRERGGGEGERNSLTSQEEQQTL